MRSKLVLAIFILLVANGLDCAHAAGALNALPDVDKGIGLPFQNESVGPAGYIGKIIKEVIKYTGLLAILALTYGGILMMLSYGDDGKIKGAKNIITYALVGIVLSGAAYAIIDAVNSLKIN